jgi:hypothetical protein
MVNPPALLLYVGKHHFKQKFKFFMADVTTTLPIVGDEQVRGVKATLLDTHRASVDANFSVRQTNGSITNVSTDLDTTLALGAAQRGAMAWMQSGGDVNKYNEIRNQYMNEMRVLKAAASGTLNPAARAIFDSQTRNFDRGAATARGLNLNSNSWSNFQTANRALATKAANGNLFNTSNQSLTPAFGGGRLQGVGYAEAQQQRQNSRQGQRR